MLKIVAAGMTALFVTASPVAYAQGPSLGGRESAADLNDLTDARINIIKATLQLTPDQQRYWPAIEQAIRGRAMDRQARIANAEQQLDELRNRGVILMLRQRNPIDFMRRRADALARRSDDLKKLADAWEPLYQTLTPDQRQRMAALGVFVVREMRNRAEQRRMQSEEDETD
jgi:LTXXQ motif family protein